MAKIPSSAKCSPNIVVISAIPGLFLAAIILGYMGLIPIKVPLSSVFVIGFIFFVFILFAKHNANYSICKMRHSYKDMEEELINSLERNSLVLLEQKKSILDIDTFLNEYYIEIRNDNFVAVAASIFPMLGILGTFIAIAISMPNFTVADTAALDNEITILLSGVGSAFYASIYGILLSLIWTYFEKSGLSKVDAYFANIKAEFKSSVWTDNELKIYEYSQYELKDNKFIAALKDTFNLEFVKNLNEQHLISFKEIMDESNVNFTNIASYLKIASTELTHTLKQMDNNQSSLEAKNSIERHLEEFTNATKEFEKNSKIFSAQLTISLNKTFEKIDTEVGDIVIKLADFATHVSLQSEEVQNSIQSYHRMVTNQVRAK
ncbi:MotA/TolQ/ExbB proton channel family protein [Sulfurimonas sp. SAG-AH-194-I05]|nr:MotA/TolQ/ExbB proton channel family protein [Sulfurimonas sp. SAG-AH-194-I05]MDF1875699.1 MotA/TolQ/ExbB proton channel family protein [Sulfurimonas sp. SAG-AH-194-I05]